MPTVEELEATVAAANVELETLRTSSKTTAAEAKANRIKAERLEADVAASKTAAEALAAKIEADRVKNEGVVNEVRTAAQARVVTAELKVAAVAAGAKDAADILALIPRDKVVLDKDGEPTNHAELVAEIKAAKPYLFGAASSGSNAPVPKPNKNGEKSVKEMTDEEYKAAKAAALKR